MTIEPTRETELIERPRNALTGDQVAEWERDWRALVGGDLLGGYARLAYIGHDRRAAINAAYDYDDEETT